jgi:hypothetical protein
MAVNLLKEDHRLSVGDSFLTAGYSQGQPVAALDAESVCVCGEQSGELD